MAEHNTLTDPNLHEVKGASTATVGQLLVATGSGTATFQTPSSLHLTTSTLVASQGSTATQNPSATNTATEVVLGIPLTTTDVNISSLGLITFNTAAYYRIKLDLNFYRSTTVGEVVMLLNIVKNSASVNPLKLIPMAPSEPIQNFSLDYEDYFTVGATLQFNIVRDGSGVNDGGLQSITPGLSGIGTVPSAYINIYKFTGM